MNNPLVVLACAGLASLLPSVPLPAQDGGFAGGKFGGRRGGKAEMRNDPAVTAAIRNGLQWLIEHQDEDGGWDPATFMRHDKKDAKDPAPPDPVGTDVSPVGATGLVLLALLADGHTERHGAYGKNVARARRWLGQQQDRDGRFHGSLPRNAVTEHTIVTFAVTEAAGLHRDPLTQDVVEAAIGRLKAMRGPSGLFGRNEQSKEVDPFTTFWATCALKSAKDFGFSDGATLRAIDEAGGGAAGEVARGAKKTDAKETGAKETGAKETGAKETGAKESAGKETGVKGSLRASARASLAADVCRRFYLGEKPEHSEALRMRIAALAALKPAASYSGADLLFWWLGTKALYQVGGDSWTGWTQTVVPALIAAQIETGSRKGSWDPIGPDAKSGGRVYATVLAVMTLQVHDRRMALRR